MTRRGRAVLCFTVAMVWLAPVMAAAQNAPPAPPPDAVSSRTWVVIGAAPTTLRGDCTFCEVEGREALYNHAWSLVADAGIRVNSRMDAGIEVAWVPAETGPGDTFRTTFLIGVAQFRPWGDLYATGKYSLKALTEKARVIGLTHPRSGRRMMKGEIHRILKNPIYMGDFQWAGKLFKGVHEQLVTRERFSDVQAVLTHKPRARYPKQKHAFMGLLTCARCDCSITAETKKGKYCYYRCTHHRGRCGNTYIREERLADLLGGVIERIQIPANLAGWIAEALHDSQGEAERIRREAAATLTQRRRGVQVKLDRGYVTTISRVASQRPSGRANRPTGNRS